MSTVDADVLQAQYFITELERVADELVTQIDTLNRLQGGKKRAEYRRAELYNIRRQIDALRRRFVGQIQTNRASARNLD